MATPTRAPPAPLGPRVALRLLLLRPVVPSRPGPPSPAPLRPASPARGPNLVAKLTGETRHDKLIEEEVFPFEEKFGPPAVIRPRTARADAGSECCERPGTGPLSQGPLSHAAMGSSWPVALPGLLSGHGPTPPLRGPRAQPPLVRVWACPSPDGTSRPKPLPANPIPLKPHSPFQAGA